MSPGALIEPGTPVTTLSSAGGVELRFAVPGTLGSRLEPGLPVRAQARGGDREFEGEVTFVSPTVDPATRSIALEARLPQPARALRPGSFVDVSLVLERRDGVLVPEQALQLRGDRQYLFVVLDDGTVRRQEVTAGARQAGEVEISGIEPGSRVVVEGIQKIADGQRVQALPAEQAPREARAPA